MNKVTRVEKHIIKENHKYYKMLDEYCFRSKNLYNFANYHVRKRFIETGEWLKYNEMDKLFKQKGNEFDYRNMPISHSAQQCLRLLGKNWKSFFVSVKDWSKHKDKYTGRPKLPKYLKKHGRNLITLVNINCKIKDGVIRFPKSFNGFTLKTKAENIGLNVILTEESYTSGTSFLDNELPIKQNYNKSRRVYRGLFVSNNGIKINADVNGAYQIIRKVFPKVNSDGIEGVGLHPIRVNC